MNKYRLSDTPHLFYFQEENGRQSVNLYQIIALRDFADITSGTRGGWVENEQALSQSGNCWIYDENSMVFAGARIEGNVRVTQPCTISHGARLKDNVWVDGAVISHRAVLSDNVTIQHSRVRGECHLFGDARVLEDSDVIAARGLTQDNDQILRIYDRATVKASRIVHQVQIYGDAIVDRAFVEHRAEVFDAALLLGNDDNNVWVCDVAKVYGNARVIAGCEEDAIPTLRYSTQVAENAVVEGNCVLKHHVLIGGNARLRGGPILLDNRVQVTGNARICGDVVIEHRVEVSGNAVIEAGGNTIHIHGRRVISGDEHITRTPLLGSL